MKLMTYMMLTGTVALLAGCATSNPIQRSHITAITHDTYPTKKPQNISFYTSSQKPQAAYRVIGVAEVSKTNLFGAKRSEETVNTMLRQLAASIGGDGIIDMNQQGNQIEAKVIAYQKILI